MALDFDWQDGERVMFLGDSIMEDPQGYIRLVPAMVTARYPERLIDFSLRGIGGNRIGDLLERLDRDILDSEPAPSWISIGVGLNDVEARGIGTPLGRFREAYRELLLRLADTKAKLVCLTTTVRGEELDSADNKALAGYNEAIREIAFAQGAQVVDVQAAFQDAIRRAQARDPDFRFTVDGVHLNASGNALLTLTLLKGIHFAL